VIESDCLDRDLHLAGARRRRLGNLDELEPPVGGKLPWLDGGYKDWEHFDKGLPFGEYNLYCFRDELVPEYYKPSDVRVWKQ